MEYRLKYRDIPWLVAIEVLPGKIIGSLFIKPWRRLMYNNSYRARVWFARFCVALLLAVMSVLLFMLINEATDGAVAASLNRNWDWWASVIQSANETAPSITPVEMGLR